MNETFNSTMRGFGVKSLNKSTSVKHLDTSSLMSPLKGMQKSASGFFSPKGVDELALKKAKQREAKVMIGLLKSEEIRSLKINAQE